LVQAYIEGWQVLAAVAALVAALDAAEHLIERLVVVAEQSFLQHLARELVRTFLSTSSFV
jgi:hypothetical protein